MVVDLCIYSNYCDYAKYLLIYGTKVFSVLKMPPYFQNNLILYNMYN